MSMRIVVRGVNWLGDALMSTPALFRLRERFPAAQIALLTPAKLAELWAHHPAINEVLPLTPRESLLKVARRVRQGGYSTAVVLPNSPRSALEVFLARVPRRIGLARQGRRWLLTDPVAPRREAVPMRKATPAEIQARLAGQRARQFHVEWTAHHSLDYLHLVAALGASSEPRPPEVRVTDAEVEAARQEFGLTPGTRWCALNAGAEYGPAKRWPASHFIEAARRVSAGQAVRWVVLGGPADGPVADPIAAALPGAVNLAARTSLRQLMAVLRGCAVLLTNDTGPMHLAAGLGVPVVVAFGSTSPELTGPGLPGDPRHHLIRNGVACSPCFLRDCPIDLRCLRELPPERAALAVLSVLSQ